MERIVIRHLSGSKANQSEEFPLQKFVELIVGRDTASHVKFDPDRDDLVSRQHLRITRDEKDPKSFVITDLGSRNGTFLNKHRIAGSMPLTPGDVVQLGPSGPEFQFEIEPRPAGAAKATRIADYPAAPATRVTDSGSNTGATAKAGVGKDTVERMLAGSRGVTKRLVINVGAALVGIVALVTGALLYMDKQQDKEVSQTKATISDIKDKMSANMSPADISAKYSGSTVYIEASWKYIHIPSGKQVYQRHVENRPMFVQFPDGTMEPWLTLEEKHERGNNRPVGGSHTGSGFVVTENGFILTNRHVAAPWHTRGGTGSKGSVFKVDENGKLRYDPEGRPVPVKMDNFVGWVPSKSKQLEGTSEGRMDVLNVTFAKDKLRIPAKVVRISNEHDTALIKIDTPQSVSKVDMFDNYESIRPGDAVTVLGYPGVSPDVTVATKSRDIMNPGADISVVPETTVTPGTVGKLIRGEGRMVDERSEYYSASDSYQLTVTATGSGNSGGPVFDEKGRVIGIFYAGAIYADGARVTFAVPIKYGMKLMQISPVLR